jgi:hypothetical protein
MKKLLLLILLPTICISGEYPMNGNLYGIKENKHIKYFCNKDSSNILSCDFEMTNVRPKLIQKEYEKKLKKGIAQALDEYEKYPPKTIDEESCKKEKNQLDEMIKIYEGKKLPSEKTTISLMYLKQLKPHHIKDLKLQLDAYIKSQCNPSKDVWRSFPKIELDIDLRTCLVGTQTWKQTFKKTGNSWVNNAGAQGSCGIIDMSRFVKADNSYKGGFWNYISEKKVINKSGNSDIGLMKCLDFDEEESEFVWNNRENIPISCDYIEWSMY